MHKLRHLLTSLNNRKRVDITPTNYLLATKVILLLLLLTSAFIGGFILFNKGITWTSLAISGSIGLSTLILVYYLYRHVRSVAIKGDSLILVNLNKKSAVMSLRSIKNVRSKLFLGLQITTIQYKLDGKKDSSVIFSRTRSLPASQESVIKHAIAQVKKSKANHKPGSVISQSAWCLSFI